MHVPMHTQMGPHRTKGINVIPGSQRVELLKVLIKLRHCRVLQQHRSATVGVRRAPLVLLGPEWVRQPKSVAGARTTVFCRAGRGAARTDTPTFQRSRGSRTAQSRHSHAHSRLSVHTESLGFDGYWLCQICH